MQWRDQRTIRRIVPRCRYCDAKVAAFGDVCPDCTDHDTDETREQLRAWTRGRFT